MAHVRTIVVQAGAKQSANYQSNEVSAMATVDLAADDDALANITAYTELLRAHVDSQLAVWSPPGQKPLPTSGRMPYDKD